ncbi:MAG: hypothetical protein IPK21_04055 [Haliscomenobacter sp.]|nr:hypothetical protein [Haliscomenobacter sp.]
MLPRWQVGRGVPIRHLKQLFPDSYVKVGRAPKVELEVKLPALAPKVFLQLANAILKRLGYRFLRAGRFSVSWTRLMPGSLP